MNPVLYVAQYNSCCIVSSW